MPTVKLQLAPGIVVDEHNNIWQAFDDGIGGMEGINWKQVGTYFAPFVAAGAGWLASRGQRQGYPEQYPPPGIQVGASSQGLFGGIDTTTLLLIGGAVLLFMSMPSRK